MTFSIKIDKTLRSNVKSLKYTVGSYSLSKHKTAGGALLFLVILWVPPKPPVARLNHITVQQTRELKKYVEYIIKEVRKGSQPVN